MNLFVAPTQDLAYAQRATHAESPQRGAGSTARRGVIARRALLRLCLAHSITAAAAALLAPLRARADIVGEVGVLLAQLGEAIKLVQNAVATVQNLVALVNKTQEILANSKTLLKMASSGRVEDILNAVQGGLSLARGAIYDIKRIHNDVVWWQQQFQVMPEQDIPIEMPKFQAARSAYRKAMVKSVSSTYDGYKTAVENADKMREVSRNAAKESGTTEGAVGQLQLINQQMLASHESISAWQQTAVQAQLLQANKLAADAQEEEQRKANTTRFFSGWKSEPTTEPSAGELPNP